VHAAREALEHLRDALESHFSLEEEIFFPALQELRPTVADSLRALSSEHAALRSQLETLASRLGFGRLTSQQGPYEAFVDALGQHERQEETLLAAFRKHAER